MGQLVNVKHLKREAVIIPPVATGLPELKATGAINRTHNFGIAICYAGKMQVAHRYTKPSFQAVYAAMRELNNDVYNNLIERIKL